MSDVESGYCMRCRLPVPPTEADEYSTWNVVTDDDGHILGMICEGCTTREEESTMFED
jgi:hypothetical protein